MVLAAAIHVNKKEQGSPLPCGGACRRRLFVHPYIAAVPDLPIAPVIRRERIDEPYSMFMFGESCHRYPDIFDSGIYRC